MNASDFTRTHEEWLAWLVRFGLLPASDTHDADTHDEWRRLNREVDR